MMKKLRTYLIMGFAALFAACSGGTEKDLVISVQEFSPAYKFAIDTIFKNRDAEGTFLLQNLSGNKELVYNERRINEGYVPASTFKIMNTMILIQEGFATDTTTIPWDTVTRGWDRLDQDLTLNEAFRYSAAWVYQKLVPQVGKPRIQYWLTKSKYGNTTLSGNVENFWMNGELEISAKQQVEFLKKLYNQNLPFDNSVQSTMKEIMKMESSGGYAWYFKTGWAKDSDPDLVWNIGFIETKDDVYFYAMNLDVHSEKEAELRKTLPATILKHMEIVPQEAKGVYNPEM